jgi:plastocyanin
VADHIVHDPNHDGIDRRGFLRCMAWAGTGMLWVMRGGVLGSAALGAGAGMHDAVAQAAGADLFFLQVSDSHIGFGREANPDVSATLQAAVDRINALPRRPAFLLHTGDISQLARPGEFDTAEQIIRGARTGTGRTFYVPGEHDVLGDHGAEYLRRHGRGTRGGGWHSFDYQGVHFVGLVNVLDLKPGGLGNLGREQLEWLERDLRPLSASTPVVVFAHVPLWTVYPQWGWGTDDGEQALGYLRRFGSVTVLNGHIHQVMQKVEGHVTFHTAMSTAFPQPSPGSAPAPGPMRVADGRLRDFLGLASVSFTRGDHSLAVVDSTLSGASPAAVAAGWATAGIASPQPSPSPAADGAAAGQVRIDNFSFNPATLTVAAGTAITWTNHDDVPHQIASADHSFATSRVIDSGQTFTLRLSRPGTYRYFCPIHPQMTGTVQVR